MKRSQLILIVSTQFVAPALLAQSTIYIVKPGDILGRIARKHLGRPIYPDVRGAIARILQANPDLNNPNLILAGQKINIPDSEESIGAYAPVAAQVVPEVSIEVVTAEYVVKPGEILGRIARKNLGAPIYLQEGSLVKIMQLNPELKNSDRIYPGQKLRIAVPRTTSSLQPEETTKATVGEEVVAQANQATVWAAPSELEPEEDTYSHFRIDPNFKFLRLNSLDKATNGSAVLLSKTHYELPVTWEQIWSKTFRTFGRFSYSHTKYERPVGKELKNPSISQYGFAVGAGFLQDQKNRVAVELGVEEQAYLKGVNTTQVELFKVPAPNAKVITEHDLYNKKSLTVGLGLKAAYFMGTNTGHVDAEAAIQYGGQLYLKQQLKSSLLGMYTGYAKTNQDTNISSQNLTEMKFGITWVIPFGK
ncbi:MAG: LysM peptidoglycan-binding domain-containing protein [Bacteriovoracaceae bacterium]